MEKERWRGLSAVVQFVNSLAQGFYVAEMPTTKLCTVFCTALEWGLSTNVLIVTIQVNMEPSDESTNLGTVLEGSPAQDTDAHA